jgi:hypothetical protein
MAVAMVARFDANGRSDATFGQGGRAIVDILDPERGLSSSQEPVALLAGERGRHTLLIRYLRHSGGTFGYNPTGLAARPADGGWLAGRRLPQRHQVARGLGMDFGMGAAGRTGG